MAMDHSAKQITRRVSPRAGAGGLILCFGLCACVRGGQDQQSGPIDFKAAGVEELRKIIADASVLSGDRLQAYQALLDRDGPQRRSGLMDVLRSADEHYAAMAGAALIQDGDESVTLQEVLQERIVQGSTFQGQILYAIDVVGRPKRLLGVPRALLREMLRRGRPVPYEEETTRTALNVSAKLLATSSEVQDRELFCQAVQVDPSLHGLWFALARGGRLDPVEAELARSVMRDDSYMPLVRVAAGTALAIDDTSAKQFVVEQILHFLQEFWQTNTVFDLLARRYSDQPVSQREMDLMLRYRRDVGVLQALLFLDDTTAKPLTLDYLRSTDVGIRMTLGMVAAKRWPEELLGLERHTFPEGEPGEFDRLLAAIVFYHPRLRAQAIAKGSKEEIERWLADVRKSTIAALSSVAGNIVAGW